MAKETYGVKVPHMYWIICPIGKYKLFCGTRVLTTILLYSYIAIVNIKYLIAMSIGNYKKGEDVFSFVLKSGHRSRPNDALDITPLSTL